jgi:hypothetical protein
MIRITINIEEEIVNDLKQAMIISGLTGNLYGIKDEFISLFLWGIEKDKSEINIQKNKNAPEEAEKR